MTYAPLRFGALAVLAVAMCSSVQSQAQPFLTNGLVAYYPFNGNANDESGLGNHGVVNGATLTADRFGDEGQAMAFNGVNQFIQAPHQPYLNFPSGDFTMACWVSLNDTNKNQFLMGKDMGSGNYPKWIIMYGSAAPSPPLTLGVCFHVTSPPSSGGWYAGSDTRLKSGVWQHVLVRKTSSQYDIFIDGAPVSAGTGLLTLPQNNTAPLSIGQSENGAFLNGKLDDVRIYGRALSDSEVQQLYVFEATSQNLTNGLVAYYPFDGNANDESGYGNNGTMLTAAGDLKFGSDRLGRQQSALFFNTASAVAWNIDGAHVDVPRAAGLDLNSDFSMSLWLNVSQNLPDGGQPTMCPIENGPYPSSGFSTLFQARTIYGGQDYWGFYFGAGGTEPGFFLPILRNVWWQFTVVRSGTNVSVFKNGSFLTNAVAGTAVNGPTIRFGEMVAHGSNGAWNPWVGGIDDCRFYNRALSAAEVQQLYAYESGVTSPPFITSQPLNQTVDQGDPVSFSVVAAGAGLNYQWQFNSVNISGATTASYTIASATTNNAGAYTVIVSNSGGSVTSSNAVLTVIPPPRTATGTAQLAFGFVVSADVTDGGVGYTNTPTVRIVGGGGSGAQAVAVVSNGVVVAVNILNAGYGYTSVPQIVINPPFIPNPVLGIAPMSFLAFSNLTVGVTYQLQQSVGWYWSNQPVSFTATNSFFTQMVPGAVTSSGYRLAANPVPSQAFATAELVNGFVVGATVTSGGSGYVTSPTVTIMGGGGTNATAVALISGGVVTSIQITSAGIGYTNTPTVRIAAPPAATVAPTVHPVMRLDCASLTPYENYQVQFKTELSSAWGNWISGSFSPASGTNSQYLFIKDSTGFIRLQHLP